MKDRKELQDSLNSSTDTELSLEVIGEILLDIRDLLTQVRAQTREIIISHVPPDYGNEDRLV